MRGGVSDYLEKEAMEAVRVMAEDGSITEVRLPKDKGFFVATSNDQPKNVAFFAGIDYLGKRYYLCTEVYELEEG